MTKSKKKPYDNLIDASGLYCPLPILKTKSALATMSSGEILKIIATDPSFEDDFPAFAEATNNLLISAESLNKTYTYYLLKK